jgi:acyl-CoA synthetase (AMP-forming)/AMP-acid ligase II
MNSPLATCF